MAFTLAKDGKRPLLYELRLRLPAESNCKVVVDYETAFLKCVILLCVCLCNCYESLYVLQK